LKLLSMKCAVTTICDISGHVTSVVMNGKMYLVAMRVGSVIVAAHTTNRESRTANPPAERTGCGAVYNTQQMHGVRSANYFVTSPCIKRCTK
jgi:hypothetical protein